MNLIVGCDIGEQTDSRTIINVYVPRVLPFAKIKKIASMSNNPIP